MVFGKSEGEHERHINDKLIRCKATVLKHNPNKLKIKQRKIKFYGVICCEEGVQPDPTKVSALEQMAHSTGKQELQSFFGLARYIGPSISNLSTLTCPLQELVKVAHNDFHYFLTLIL